MAIPESNSWHYKVSFAETNAHMLDQEILCDVTFLAGETREEVKCHKFMLASRSPVFYAMFCGALKETESTIAVPDIDADIMKTIVRFIYTGACDAMTVTSALSLTYAAIKYDIPVLRNACFKYIAKNVSPDNVFEVLSSSYFLDESEIKKACLQVICVNAMQILDSDGFVHISRAVLSHILDQQEMVCFESDIYAACKRWAAHLCTQNNKDSMDHKELRNALGDLVFKIRFPAMSIEDFCDTAATENVLTEREKNEIYKDIIHGSRDSNFDATRRFGEGEYIERLDSIADKKWKYSEELEGISFTTRKAAIMHSIGLYLPKQNGTVEGGLEIFETDRKILTQNVSLSMKTGQQVEYVPIQKPVLLKPSTTYSITLCLKGVDTYFGRRYNIGYCPGGVFVSENGSVSFTPLSGRSKTTLFEGQIHGLYLAFINKRYDVTVTRQFKSTRRDPQPKKLARHNVSLDCQ